MLSLAYITEGNMGFGLAVEFVIFLLKRTEINGLGGSRTALNRYAVG